MLKGTVAAPGQLTEEQIARVEGKFSELLGQEVSLSLRVDPSLIGGLRVLSGQHDLSDVLAALALSLALSLAGYLL